MRSSEAKPVEVVAFGARAPNSRTSTTVTCVTVFVTATDTSVTSRPASGDEKLSPTMLHGVPDWPENQALRDRRAELKAEYGAVGERACFFTEGGYCTMFSEGMRLEGRGGVDDMIASACALA